MTTQSTFPVLRSERLVLREMREADLERLTEYLSDYDVAKMLCSPPHPFSLEDGQQYLAQTMGGDLTEEIHWAIEHEGQFCGYFKANYLTTHAGIGYWLGKPHWGKGLMSEALHLALTYLFQKRGLETLQTGAFRCNPASLRVLQKVGFVTKGLRTNTSNARGGEELEEEFLKVSIDQFRTESDEHSPFKDKELL
ncbi:putative ribosomal N-acetyltransferase YdaF [Pseudovibrio sp. Ad46]|uniref:GNAT family N-acetyltransferase n=1 Tax=Pseudovibrio sp. Ad46 TaxID=989432 RepID=UPI0007AE71D5|nr:GNAT family N-acetyltransferase [Pseudovibrio sp. Ad46]KZK95684.1 putative ribosomal N-acetyltransferase YdaF [Pseudovibrio sp. Ad46]